MDKSNLPAVKFFWDYRGTGKPPGRFVTLHEMLGLQDKYLNRKLGGDKYNFLVFAEHEHVYCCPQEKIKALVDSGHFLKRPGNSLPAKFVAIPERHGGSLTYHGPGQLTCYLIICLEDLGIKGANHLTVLLDEIIKETLLMYDVHGVSVKEIGDNSPETQKKVSSMSAQGIWVLNNLGQMKKIASRGLHNVTAKMKGADGKPVLKHFTKFGFCINVYTDLSYFSHIYPCGLDIEMTSIRQHTGRKPSLPEVARAVANVTLEKLENLKRRV